MNYLRQILLVAALLISAVAARAQFYWTGLAPDQDIASGGNWRGNTAPVFDGTEDLIFGKAINNTVSLSSDLSLNSITLAASDDYHFISGSAFTITLGNGIYGSLTGSNNRIAFDQSIDIAGTGVLTMDAGNHNIVISGKIIGSTDLYLTNLAGGTTGAFIFNDTCTGSSFTGNTYISGVAGTPVTVAFWNDQPFGDGTGTLYVQNGAQLIAHGSRDVVTDMVFNTTLANDPIYFRSWDDVLTFEGDATLLTNTTLVAQMAQYGVPSVDNSGVYPLPGPRTRHPIVFDGAIDESLGSHSLTVNGAGVLILEGNDTYTGGTTVNGSLVFANTISAPGGVNKVKATLSGYAGFADNTPGNLVTFLNTKIDKVNSSGAVGVDTLPGDATYTFTDNINLSSFTNPNIRIGSATSAILTGTITPQGASYRFGNGGGTLYVRSKLTGGRAVLLNNGGQMPLTLYLQEATALTANDYTGVTSASNGFIIFDGAYALPGGANSLAATSAGNSYIGYTDVAGIGGTTLASTNAFLGLFNTGTTTGILGFDTHAGNSTVNIADNLDLMSAGFTNGVYLGTTTGAILTGTLRPTADNILRLTAAQGSTLEINTPLGPTTTSPNVNALSLGTTAGNDIYSNGTVFLSQANTYAGGTTINSTGGGLTLEVGDNNSLGTGTLTIPQSVIAGLQASTYNIMLPNNVVFSAGGSPGQLFITGGSGLELDGNISGPGSISVMGTDYPYLTLGGNNTFTGDLNLYLSTLTLANDNAAGLGTVRFLENSTLNFNTLNPVLHGISGRSGIFNMNDGLALTFDMSNPVNEHEFGGFMGNESPPNASVTVTSTTGGDAMYLYGNSNYSGGTFILNKGALALGSSSAVGSGAVTLNTTMAGALALNVGVTLTNDLIYTGGTLQGFGIFNPTSVNSVGNAPITFGTGQGVVPGIYGLGSHGVPGRLTLASGADFANGGAMLWSIQDGSRPDGFSTLVVDGANNLNISATSGQFTLFLASFDSTGAPGFASNLTLGANNMYLIATTTGGASITNFSAADFTVDTSLFSTPVSSVFLTADTNNIWINFTPIPEPSTYALLGLGLGAVFLSAHRRRRRI